MLAVHESIPLFQRAHRELKRMSSTVISDPRGANAAPSDEVNPPLDVEPMEEKSDAEKLPS